MLTTNYHYSRSFVTKLRKPFTRHDAMETKAYAFLKSFLDEDKTKPIVLQINERKPTVSDIIRYWKHRCGPIPPSVNVAPDDPDPFMAVRYLAFSLLSAQASSIPSERAFRRASDIDTRKRNRISHDHLGNLVKLNSWLKEGVYVPELPSDIYEEYSSSLQDL